MGVRDRSTWRRPVKGRARSLIGLWMVALLAVAACGGGATEGDEGAQAAAVSEDAATGTGSPDAATGGTLRFGWTIAPTNFDPARASSSQDMLPLAPVYDRLVHLSPEGEPIPGLATEWALSDDALTLDLTLREGVTFQDGEVFDAAAVKANLERTKTLEGSALASDLSLIDTVEVIDPLHVRLHLSSPGGALILVLSDRPGMMVSPAAFDTDLSARPVGAGMYRVTSYDPGAHATYERWDGYWDPSAAPLDVLEITFIGDPQTLLNGVQSGQLDAASITAGQVDAAESAGLEVLSGDQLPYLQLQLNRTRSEFDDVRVRQALNYAIDREAMTAALLFGHGTPALQPFPAGYFAHNDEVPDDHYAYDPERARQLLADAGLPDGFTFEAIASTLPITVSLGEALQAYFADIGVRMDLRLVDPAQSTDLFFAQQTGDAFVAGCVCRPDPWQTVYQMFSSEAFSNPGGHTTPEIEGLIEEAAASAVPAERAAAFHEIGRLVVEEAMNVPVYSQKSILVHSGQVVGLTTYVNGKPEFRGVGVAG